MLEQLESLCVLISMLLHLYHVLWKDISTAISSNTAAPSPPPLSWKRLTETPILASKKDRDSPKGKNDAYKSTFKSRTENMASLDPEDSVKDEATTATKLRRRPARIVIPQPHVGCGFGEAVCNNEVDAGRTVMEVEGNGYCLASRKGTRHIMEDGYGVITNIHGDPKQAFFGVFDGHGGREAVDFVVEKLGQNIITALGVIKIENEEHRLELAIKSGYRSTDLEFLSQGLRSGACAATVLLKKGELHASNVGDCRVVICRNGIARALTDDHRPGREDEKNRIENSGGYVDCRGGVWRVQDSLAISRAIGDANMKEWIISEPDTTKLELKQDCEFLIMASDGLWDKVSNQEAVDVVLKQRISLKSCKELLEMSCSRGNMDDITVMVVDLQSFCKFV
ncbi:hypothetical protein HPP92_009209 [Vanilla planifolia]|uniref:protein-serine/threonine phosphatase n=1 Tax=Vanilla planifolia TaxID=51239 RepID=A0A835RBY5_VANPL|nr:hypothetical protein HPP92_009209 [Vanilla planifolia]